jgi:SAM-dependent methyltransferase
MKDFKAISNTIKNKLKHKIFGKSSYGNIDWKKANFKWYERIHDENIQLHANFIDFLDIKRDLVETILEVGCGTGVYPIKYGKLFNGLKYTGIDFSQTNIEYCKKNSTFNFISGDFIKMDVKQEYDLVFSHAVVDHVYDIDAFVMNLVKSCKKFAYINAYRGFFPDLVEHEMKWREDDNCYYNKISVKQIERLLLNNEITKNQFKIRSQDNGDIDKQLVIEIDKTK